MLLIAGRAAACRLENRPAQSDHRHRRLAVGNTHESRLRSGITAVLFDQPVVAAVDVRGGGPGSRETDLLAPENTVEAIDALVLPAGPLSVSTRQGSIPFARSKT